MPLDDATAHRLASVRTIDLITTGRLSGRPARVEIWWFRFDDRFVITGTPGPRDWLANIRTDPTIVIHADGADYPAKAVEVDDPEVRRRFFDQTRGEVRWYRSQAQLDRLVAEAPMVEIRFT
jgi:deazaflavin-dependent oxidoreductase (nitroreductase family)